ncbi:MAG: DUF4124 domain-containing protein [Sideroxydans sp.]|nr:DUF4124 domain-containing protein [Sideroxydans sp.]
MKYFMPVLLMLFSCSANAELHKWVDSAGKVHYSDAAPPADAQEQQVHIPRAPADTTSETPAEKSVFEREAELNKALKAKEEAAQQAAQQQKEAETRQKNCINARNGLASLQNAPRITTYDDKGNQIIMDDATRQRNIEDAQKAVGEFCD